jgi:hypothetical protein
MDRNKKIVFKYFDMIYSGYNKIGRGPKTTRSSHVLYEYINDDGRIAFTYHTNDEDVFFNYDDFYTAKNMLGVPTSDLSDICREYVAYKIDNPNAISSKFFLTRK